MPLVLAHLHAHCFWASLLAAELCSSRHRFLHAKASQHTRQLVSCMVRVLRSREFATVYQLASLAAGRKHGVKQEAYPRQLLASSVYIKYGKVLINAAIQRAFSLHMATPHAKLPRTVLLGVVRGASQKIAETNRLQSLHYWWHDRELCWLLLRNM